MPGPDLTLLLEAAQTAGRIAERHFQAYPETWEKPGGAGPVTEADLEVDRVLRAELTAARPDYGWLSEESADSPDRLARDHCFIIDPIDGTRAYIAGEDHWSHSLAIARDGVVVAAVVYLPMLDRIYAAEAGSGATFNGAPMRASGDARPDGATVLGSKPNFDPRHWPGGLPEIKRHFRPSLAYRMALVAQGRFDAMVTFRDTWEWDVAAGTLLVQAAGGTVTDRAGHLPRFNNAAPKLNGLVAAGGPMHAALRPHFTGENRP